MIYKKIFSQTILNLINSALAFLFTYTLIKLTSVSVVGELYVILAAISIVLIVQTVLPPNFSVIRIQDKKGFLSVLLSFYFYIQIVVFALGFVVARCYFLFDIVSCIFFSLLCCLVGFTNLFDIIFQAAGRLDIFLKSQIVLSILKAFCIFIFYFTSFRIDLLLAIFLLSHSVVIAYLWIATYRNYGEVIKVVSLRRVFKYTLSAYKLTKRYYLTTLVKKVFDSAPALFVSSLVSRETIGYFSLYQKCLIFGVSFLRTIESLLLNKSFSKKFDKKILYFATPVCQLIVIVFGASYLFFTADVAWVELVLFSFCVYPISIVISLRAKLISTYRADILNKAMLATFFPYTFYVLFLVRDSLGSVLGSYFILILFNALFLMFFCKANKIGPLRFFK